MLTVAEMQTRLAKISEEIDSIRSEQGELPTKDAFNQIETLEEESKGLESSIEMAMKSEKAHQRAEKAKNIKFPRQTEPTQPGQTRLSVLPATVKKWNSLKCFKDDGHATADVKAYRFGQFLKATLGSDKSRNWCMQQGMEICGAMGEDTNSKGGYLVPGEFSSDLIKLVEERGAFRRNARVIGMGQDTLSIPRYVSGNTAYFVGEATAITESDMTLDQVQLVAKKLGAIVPISGELSDDAILNVADMVAQDIAYKFADKEDECGFNGVGGATYGGIVGVRQQLIEQALGGDETSAAPAAGGLVRYGTGHSYANISIANLTEVIGRLPMYAERGAKWYMSKVVWSYLLDLMADAGGNTLGTLAAGTSPRFLGYEVQLVDVMPKASAINQICVLLGDLAQAATFGDRRSVTMAMSNQAYVGSTSMFETDQTAIRGIERFDINVHDVGSATATGPIVGLISHTA